MRDHALHCPAWAGAACRCGLRDIREAEAERDALAARLSGLQDTLRAALVREGVAKGLTPDLAEASADEQIVALALNTDGPER